MAARHSTVAAAVEYVNSRARAGEAQPRSSRRLTVLAAARQAAAAGAAKGFVPSGPRGKGVGCEDEVRVRRKPAVGATWRMVFTAPRPVCAPVPPLPPPSPA